MYQVDIDFALIPGKRIHTSLDYSSNLGDAESKSFRGAGPAHLLRP